MFGLADAPDLSPRYNVAPSQPVATVRVVVQGGARRVVMARWGLVPKWADDPGIGARMINARAETAAQKPAFRAAMRRRRCLVLADGFYEWRREAGGKQPYYVRMKDRRPFALAGLYEQRADEETGEVLDTCTVLTTDSNETVRRIHHRMPVILPPKAYDLWLDPEVRDPERLSHLLGPYPAEAMEAYPVSRRVNSPQHDDPTCHEPAEPSLTLPGIH